MIHKKRKKLVISCIIAVLGYCLLKPPYDKYIEQDHYDTCWRARGIIFSCDHGVIGLSGLEDVEGEEERYRYIIREYFHVEMTEDMKVPGLCRESGTWTISKNEDSGKMCIECDAPGHGVYEDPYESGE